jgi:hypothetical protein
MTVEAPGMGAVLPFAEEGSASQEARHSDYRSGHTLRNYQKSRAGSSMYPRSACGNARHRQTPDWQAEEGRRFRGWLKLSVT